MKRILIPLAIISALGVSCAHRRHMEAHNHTHGPSCGHVAITHDGHTDYVHDGHLHYVHDGHVDDHVIPVNAANPDRCTPNHGAGEHPKDHVHGQTCGHAAVPHGDHTDYVIGDHLHHVHAGHCDEHGPVQVANK